MVTPLMVNPMRYIPLVLCLLLASIFVLDARLANAASLAQDLSGRILIQTEARGEAYYVDPVDLHRYFLDRPSDAFLLMTSKGLGIAHSELQAYLSSSFPSRLHGRILLDIQRRGEAYYIDPVSEKAFYLGTPSDAFELMQEKGLGITSADLETIPLGTLGVDLMEKATINKINEHRRAEGVTTLAANTDISLIARAHSRAMARGEISFEHEGFSGRVDQIRVEVHVSAAAENIGMSDADQPIRAVVQAWLASADHRQNIESDLYEETGVGIATDGEGTYYFTQIFVDTD